MQYLIVGAGPAGISAAETLRDIDPEAGIKVIGAEDAPPYSRMAIPYFLEGNIEESGTNLRISPDHFSEKGIELLRNRKVVRVDTSGHCVELDDGSTEIYDRLLLATGSRPLPPPIEGLDLPGVHPCWTLEDARQIKALLTEGAHVVLIGAGFIGTIILDALGSQNLSLTVVEADTHMTPRMMDRTGGDMMKAWCESKGVTLFMETMVNRISAGGERALSLELSNGQTLPADLVVTATGVTPIIEYLDGSGIETDEGILVDNHLRTNVPEVYVAGDVAQGKDFSTGGQSVHAIQPTATEHGQVAARNMAGEDAAYQGSLIMNVVATLGLTTYSFGSWMGVEGGEHAESINAVEHQYVRLEFLDDVLVGAINIGPFEHVGILRGMIQSRIPLGDWKAKLMEDPRRIMEAYLGLTEFGKNIPIMTPTVQ